MNVLGAYKLNTADFSNNFLKTLPFDLFKRNHVMTKIDLSNNQIKIVPPRLLLGLNLLEEISFAHKQRYESRIYYNDSVQQSW